MLKAHLFQVKMNGDKTEQRSIIFASRTLQKHENSYNVIEKQLLAIFWEFSKFKNYLLGHKVIVSTDHKALTYIQ